MSKTVAYCSLIAVGLFLAVITVVRPTLFSDQNHFLKDFVRGDVLLVAGIVLTITLASAGQVHLSLNEIESRVGRVFLHKTRAGVHSSAYFLIWLFLAMVPLVIAKPYLEDNVFLQSLFNSAALFALFWMVLIMASLTKLIFAIRPHIDADGH